MPSKLWQRPKNVATPDQTFLSRRGYAILKEGNEDLVEYLKQVLTVVPKVNPGAPGAIKPEPFSLYKENSKKLYLPRAFGMDWFGAPSSDAMTEGDEAPGLKFNGTLRHEQELPVSCFLNACQDPTKRGGILSMSCAAGKTVMGLYIACALGRKTLVICHKEFLLNQWKERIEQFVPDAKVGLIKAQVVDTKGKDIVLASLQSLAMKEYDPKLFDAFGTVLADECHHLSAQVFSQALTKVSCKYMLGLSATLDRKDGLRKVFEWFLGRPVYETKKRADSQMIIKMIPYRDPLNPDYSKELLMWNGKKNVPQMINAICSYKPRNDLIIKELKELVKDPERRVLILSDRRNHLKELEKRIRNDAIASVGYYVGGMKEEELRESQSKHIILATYTMAAEGMDIPQLNALILASPVSAIEQPIGRIQRQKAHERKCIPYTVDIWDQHSLFRGQGKRRCEFYIKNNYTVHGIHVENDLKDDESEEDKNKKLAFQYDSDEDASSN